jgi:hypothetical protein
VIDAKVGVDPCLFSTAHNMYEMHIGFQTLYEEHSDYCLFYLLQEVEWHLKLLKMIVHEQTKTYRD